MRILTAVLAISPLLAAGKADFGMWTPSELKQRESALARQVGPDHSARETVADYGDHRFRLLYRDADGFPEEHDNIVDIVMVQSGEGSLVLGGTMLEKKGSATTGEYTGSKLQGGELHPLAPGDVVHIPAGIPHSFLVPSGKHITYLLLKFPGR